MKDIRKQFKGMEMSRPRCLNTSPFRFPPNLARDNNVATTAEI
jgi:hypothetical protein